MTWRALSGRPYPPQLPRAQHRPGTSWRELNRRFQRRWHIGDLNRHRHWRTICTTCTTTLERHLRRRHLEHSFGSELVEPIGRGLHSFTLELNLSNSRTHARLNLGYAVDRRAQDELNWEGV